MQPPLVDAQAEGKPQTLVDRDLVPESIIGGGELQRLYRPGADDTRRSRREPPFAITTFHTRSLADDEE
jgi:hypothetical protein